MPGITFNPDRDIPSLSGKVILITGGLGAETARQLAKHAPAHIYISGRKASSADIVIEQIRQSGNTLVTFLQCDLADLRLVQKMADLFLARESRLDVLMCNAGIMATPLGLTADGYEVQFGTNHLGHALLIQKLLPRLQATAGEGKDVRIFLLTSLAYRMYPRGGVVFEHLSTTQEYSALGGWVRYGQSKLANMLYARELARRYPTLTSISVTPGAVNTGLLDNLGCFGRAFIWVMSLGRVLRPEEGAYNQLWAATTARPDLQNGQFHEPVGILSTKLKATARDEDLAKRLWDWTDEALRPYL
ncbi:oxidoreductase, short-chain dehydrogenase/reductase family [Aspergillus homomorphus CBS 101889]|uniref:Oxidoreductase n=1 Tax=Aspergillus homomorphus (strain CBS 101889) TaxID=1450537 RepID=A0A395HME0_ASPHC|nr:oxidoreductase [Aspergillus homomorphus CBS 101889]RAL08786.1 oxidoreductase [Aspergillus homomorphus CBS 101889]